MTSAVKSIKRNLLNLTQKFVYNSPPPPPSKTPDMHKYNFYQKKTTKTLMYVKLTKCDTTKVIWFVLCKLFEKKNILVFLKIQRTHSHPFGFLLSPVQ